jgi:hypothetical protein
MGSYEMSQPSAEEKRIKELEEQLALLKSDTLEVLFMAEHHISNTNVINAIQTFIKRNQLNQLKQLRFTTTRKPLSMFQMGVFGSLPTLRTPKDKGELITDIIKGSGAYIHGEAEKLAGFDIVSFIDGNTAQLDLPIDKQDILMMLPSGEYECKAEFYKQPGSKNKYLITLKDEPRVLDEDGLLK